MDDKKYSHLEEAFFNNPVASVNDRTGYVRTPPADKDGAENLAELLSVPVTSHLERDSHNNKLTTDKKKP